MFGKSSHNGVSRRSCAPEFSYGHSVELGYARVSTAQQDLSRQIDALTAVGIAPERIYLDNKSGATVDRPGLRAVLGFAPRGDVIVVHTAEPTQEGAVAPTADPIRVPVGV